MVHPLFAFSSQFGSRFGQWIVFVIPVVLMFSLSSAQAADIRVSSGTQVFEPFTGRSHFEGNVLVAMEGTQISGPQADFSMDKNGKASSATFSNRPKMVRQGTSVKQTIQADTLNMGLDNGAMKAKGNVVTQMSGAKEGDVSIKSDHQEFDQQHGVMKAVGHVTVKKGDALITSPEALIFLGASGGAEKAVFIKGAKLIQGDQEIKAETITIKLDTGDIFAERNTQSSVLSKDSEGKTTRIQVQSHLQELDHKTGTLIANGNTLIHYDDYVAKGPKAVFYRENDTLNRIVMTGRAMIDDPDRRVTGDTVVITVNPKQFNAKGNVTTFIKAKNQEASNTEKGKPAATNGSSGHAKTSANSTASSSADAFEQEMMIEKATSQQGGN